MFSFLKSRTFVTVVGLLLIALFIWFAGPFYRPLESIAARLLLIALVVALWAIVVLLMRLRANRASDKLVDAVVSQSRKGQPSAEAVQLRERFEEAVATLKQKRRGGHSLYDLPWYVIIGAPGSGKTTALVNSGLNFPLEQRSGKAALRGIGGTRNCDWWFTEEAVFLDTAGRYTTQDSDASSDSAAWSEFLRLLRTYRKRRPLNGVVFAISAQDLLTLNDSEREAYITAARHRLNELNRELRIVLPVYLMVTKCDLVAGFSEYFDDLDREGRAQVWGVTFPPEQTREQHPTSTFPAEFETLIARLNGRMFSRLRDERELRRRAKVFAFPQQMMALRDSLADFAEQVFSSTRFDARVLLRGIYLTSGTQEGTPIDRLLGAIGRRFAVASEAVVQAGGRGKAYFIERLLKDVLLAESGLAGVNRRVEVQKAAAQLAVYAAMALIAVVGVALLWVSYSQNERYIRDVSAKIAELRSLPTPPAGASLDAVLPWLDAMRAVDETANRYRRSTPWTMRWGLFQGNALGDVARDTYVSELGDTLLPTVVKRFNARMIRFKDEPEKLYEYFKGYLMLVYPDNLNKDGKNQVTYLTDLEWQASYATDPDRIRSVTNHFQNLLNYSTPLPRQTPDTRLIEQTRSTLRLASPAGLVYRNIKIGYANDTRHQPLDLAVAAGLGAERVLQRRTRGASLKTPMPAIYTKPVFWEIAGKETNALIKRFTEEYWVWGTTRPEIGTAGLREQVLDIYEKDYIAAWDQIVNDIQATPLTSVAATKEALEILAGPTSPLRGLLHVIDENTYLEKPAESDKPGVPGVLDGIGNNLKQILGEGQKAAGVAVYVPGAQVKAHFEAIHRLMAGEKGSAQIDGILQKLRELQQKMQPLGEGVGNTSVTDAPAIAGVGATANDLKREAAPLPPGIGAVVNEVAAGAARAVRGGVQGTLEARYQQEVVHECTAIIANRYPFAAVGADVPLADFARLFGPNGVYDTFFAQELKGLVDTSRSSWVWKNDEFGNPVSNSAAMLRQFEAASRIRRMFLWNGTPSTRFTMTAAQLDAAATRFLLEIDGQALDYRHGPERPIAITWPGPNPGVAVATFEDRSGARPNLSYPGPWALFRLIDAGQIQDDSDATRVRYVLTLESGGHQAKVTIEAQSILNPFARRELRQFNCQS